MQSQHITRDADSPWIHAVTRWVIGTVDRTIAVPDGCWDLVIVRHDTRQIVLLTGQTTKAVPLNFTPGDEVVTISFHPSAFLAFVPAVELVDQGIVLANTRTRFRLVSDVFEIPTFETAESFVQQLVQTGHLRTDEVVAAVLQEQSLAYSPRALQRHFVRTTGMTHAFFRQIQRARQAAERLQHGAPAIDVAYDSGYADQSHMSRSLKRILGQTPTEIAALPRL